VTAIRGKGLLLGLKCDRPAREVQSALLECDILAGTSTDPDVLRLLPPLVLQADARRTAGQCAWRESRRAHDIESTPSMPIGKIMKSFNDLADFSDEELAALLHLAVASTKSPNLTHLKARFSRCFS
jgi:hypothetical protein